MAAQEQVQPGMAGEARAPIDANSARNKLSGVRYSNTGQQFDEIDVAEDMLACIRNLPLLEEMFAQLDDEHDQLTVAASNAPEESLQPIIDAVISNSHVVKAIFDVNNKFDHIEYIFNCLFAILAYVRDDQYIEDINLICKILCNQTDEFTQINVKLLSLIFNMVPNHLQQQQQQQQQEQSSNGQVVNLRANIMEEILQLIYRTKNRRVALQWNQSLRNLIQWVEDWKLNPKSQQKRNIYYSASLVAGLANNEILEQKYSLLFLKTFGKDDKVDKVAIELASKAMIGAIKNEKTNTRVVKDLRKSAIFSAMCEMKEHSELCDLMKIVYSGNVLDFNKYLETNEKYLESVAIDKKVLLEKMRLLTLCSLGHKAPVISFDDLKKELLIDTLNELESIVIDAIKSKLVEARIDHLREQVVINRTSMRVFEQETWDEIAAKLQTWRENTTSIYQVMKNSGLAGFLQ